MHLGWEFERLAVSRVILLFKRDSVLSNDDFSFVAELPQKALGPFHD